MIFYYLISFISIREKQRFFLYFSRFESIISVYIIHRRRLSAALFRVHRGNTVPLMKKLEQYLSNDIIVMLAAVFCCMLWGSAFPMIKTGYRLMGIASGDTSTQLLYAGVRFSLAGVLVIVAGSLLEGRFLRPTRRNIAKVIKLSSLQTFAQYAFFYIGLAHASGVKASIIEGSNVFCAILISGCLYRLEKIRARHLLGCLLGFAGVVLVNIGGGELTAGFSLIGEGFIFISCVCYAFSSVYIKLYSQTESPVMLSGWQFLFGGIALSLVGFAAGGRLGGFSPSAALCLLYLGFLSAAAYTLWGMLLKYNPVSKVSIYGFSNPVFGVILSALILGEGSALNIGMLISLLLVCCGIFICNFSRRKEM